MKVLATVAAAALTLLTFAPASQAASFNCRSSALSYTERTVCDNPQLSRLDSKMAAIYFGIIRTVRGAARAEVQGQQVNWLQSRNGCGASFGCLKQAYEYQIDDLRSFYAP
jgi:uncharacterized protein